MANDTEKLWAITDEIRKDTNETKVSAAEIRGDVSRIAALFEVHVENKCIHHNEPCEDLKKLNWKIVAAMGTATTTLVGMVWKCLT